MVGVTCARAEDQTTGWGQTLREHGCGFRLAPLLARHLSPNLPGCSASRVCGCGCGCGGGLARIVVVIVTTSSPMVPRVQQASTSTSTSPSSSRLVSSRPLLATGQRNGALWAQRRPSAAHLACSSVACGVDLWVALSFPRTLNFSALSGPMS